MKNRKRKEERAYSGPFFFGTEGFESFCGISASSHFSLLLFSNYPQIKL